MKENHEASKGWQAWPSITRGVRFSKQTPKPRVDPKRFSHPQKMQDIKRATYYEKWIYYFMLYKDPSSLLTSLKELSHKFALEKNQHKHCSIYFDSYSERVDYYNKI